MFYRFQSFVSRSLGIPFKTVALSVAFACAMSLAFAPGAQAQFTFGTPVNVDAGRPGGSEPGIIVDNQGRIFVNAPEGLSANPSFVWRSEDGGQSYQFVAPGLIGASADPGALVGGGDSNLAFDAANNLYFIDLWLGNSSTSASSDSGANWTGQPFGTIPIQDRPWVSADPRTGSVGTVYSVTEQLGTGLFISKSAGALNGVVYPVSLLEVSDQTRCLIGTAPAGSMATNMKGDTYNVYSTFCGSNGAGIGLAKLPAGGLTATNNTVTPANSAFDQTQSFPVVAVGNAADDNVYVVWTDPTPSGWNIRFASSSNGGTTWSNAVTIGSGLYPWITADSPGKVDVGWYSAARGGYTGNPNNAPSNTVWDVDFAQSVNALSTTPTFTAPVQAATGAKTGAVCTQGTNCSGDRELGDFMSIAHNASGDALLSYVSVPSSGGPFVFVVSQTGGTTIQ